MLLQSFDVQGFRSLADVRGIPLRSPTILTGHNDGGKSATLEALGFLLNSQAPKPEDRTYLQGCSAGGADVDRRVPELVVVGEFVLSGSEQKELELPEKIRLRRRLTGAEAPMYEVLRRVPADENLRGLDVMKLADLKEVAASQGIKPVGSAAKLDSWRTPLLEVAAAGVQVDAWTRASRDVIDQLPMFLMFSSMDEPDPEAQVRTVLYAAYRQMLEDTRLVAPVRELEETITAKLQAAAEQLCEHIQCRVPELTSVSAVPTVSFRDGFNSVQLRAYKNEEDVALRQAGAGRRRRISLAVWEWTSLGRNDGTQESFDQVIAYDEPDTHLDYAKQRELVDLIHLQCQNPRVRMIVATHSLNLIDRVDIADVVQLRLENGRTVMERLVDESHEGVDRYLSQLSAAMGLRTSVLLHQRCFLAVEGQTEEQTFPLLFRLVTGKPLQSAGIALICGKSNDGALKVTQFLIEHKRDVVFIVDKDSENQKVFKPKKLRDHGVKDHQIHYIGAPDELEELYADDQWSDTMNDSWPRTDGREWAAGDVAALRDNGKFSDKLKKLIWLNTDEGPSSKQEMNMRLVLRLRTADEVPLQFREKFELVARIASDGYSGVPIASTSDANLF